MSFHQARMVPKIRIELLKLFEFFPYLPEYICNRLRFTTSDPGKKGIAWFNVQFHGSNACTILSAVVLLFHQEVELVQTPKYRTIFLLVVREGLAKADKGQTTFMFYCIHHWL